jgi:O-antigen ligase
MTPEIAILLVLTAGLLVLVLFFLNPSVAFFALIVLRIVLDPLTSYRLFNSTLTAGTALSLLFIVFAVFLVFRKGKLYMPVFMPFLFFIFCAALSILKATDYGAYLTWLFKYCTIASLFVIPYNLIDSTEEGERSLRYFLYTALVPVFYGLYQIATGNLMVSKEHLDTVFLRVTSFFVHPNAYAFYLGVVAIGLIVYLARARAWQKWFYYLLLVLVAVSIIFTYSRSVWLTLCGSLLIGGFWRKKIFPVMAVLALIVVVFFSGTIIRRFGDITGGGNKEAVYSNSLEFRKSITHDLLYKAFPKHPVLGFGLGSANMVVSSFTGMDTIPHNDYMRVLVETGLVGFVAFIMFLLSCFWFVFVHRRELDNIYLWGVFMMVLYFTVEISGSNQMGSIVDSGFWFCLLGIFVRTFEVSDNKRGDASA